VGDPTEEQQRQAHSLGITLVKEAPPQTTELRGLCETLVGPSSPISIETKHLGTLGAVVLHNDQRKYLTAAHVVKDKTQICVRFRAGENFEDVGMVFSQQWYCKQAGQIYLDVALGTMNEIDVLAGRGSISRLDFSAVETFAPPKGGLPPISSSSPQPSESSESSHSRQSSLSSQSTDDANSCYPLLLNYHRFEKPRVYLFGSVSWLSTGN